MELQQLKYFRAAAELQHVKHAAEKMFVAPSAISRAIAQLEDELGVQLFYRRGRSIVLTRYGRQFLDYTIQAQNLLENAKYALAEKSGIETGIVSLGFLPSLGLGIVPHLLKEYRQKYPRIQFTLIQRVTKDLIAQLDEGSIDLCLSVPWFFDHPGVQWAPLYKEELVIVLPRTHPFASKPSLRLKELANETFLSLSPGNTLNAFFEKACMEAKFTPKIAFKGMNTETVRGMIAAGLGIAVLPRSPVRTAGIVEIKLSQPSMIRTLGIGWIKDRYLPPCAVAFRKFVQSKARRG